MITMENKQEIILCYLRNGMSFRAKTELLQIFL
jgi:hypothetical protein